MEKKRRQHAERRARRQADGQENLFSLIERQIAACPDRTALETESGRRYRYGDLEAESARLAGFLAGSGLLPGDRVTVQVEKSPENLLLYLACLRAGFVYHPLNLAYQASEIEYFLDNAQPACVVCRPEALATMETLAAKAGVRRVLTLDAAGGGSLMTESRSASAQLETVPRAADDLAALIYSSGTTGRPKGVMLSHRNLTVNAQALIAAWGFEAGDRLLHALPIFHVHGLFVATHCTLLSGASMRFLPRFDAGSVLRFLPECTVFMGVPTYYTRLLAEPALDAALCGNVRLFIAGSAPLLPETFHHFRQRTGHAILERYGMSETGMNSSNPLRGERRPGSVGLPLPGVELRIVDAAGRAARRGEAGELQVKGENVFRGYWRMPEKSKDDFTEDGWFRTGDLGTLAEDGYVSIVGRAKDLIITGGLNVYPKEIELCIDQIEGVEESAVIGLPHADFGEAVTAVVKCRPGEIGPTEAAIIARLKNQLANFKVPKRVYFLDELPRNAMGKVQKKLLRERYAASRDMPG